MGRKHKNKGERGGGKKGKGKTLTTSLLLLGFMQVPGSVCHAIRFSSGKFCPVSLLPDSCPVFSLAGISINDGLVSHLSWQGVGSCMLLWQTERLMLRQKKSVLCEVLHWTRAVWIPWINVLLEELGSTRVDSDCQIYIYIFLSLQEHVRIPCSLQKCGSWWLNLFRGSWAGCCVYWYIDESPCYRSGEFL